MKAITEKTFPDGKMRQKAKSPTRKPNAIDLFSGCGGLTLGLKQAGFRVLAAVEIDADAVSTYKIILLELIVKHKYIRMLSPVELILELKLRVGALDLLACCPPCQSFSTLRTLNGANKEADARNNLINQMLRFARAFKPKAIMMEN